ncbi:hypothetical protein B0H65DRAFT_536385 [Neurospora tetraspora]|uniref:Uncharacterized protein n=1 Tax=Neurospora tetraspora TaxID=94610 RepID=A0AAE0JQ90_9PEZI|nr:hypothetical protein B0H65DRAFT_536385 [Neurospora tetraspora]
MLSSNPCDLLAVIPGGPPILGLPPKPCQRKATSPKEEDKKRLLPKGTKGLAHSRFAKKPSNKGNGKAQYTKKIGPTPDEDAAVKAFFAESPKKYKEQKDNGESSYQAADHDTPRAKRGTSLRAMGAWTDEEVQDWFRGGEKEYEAMKDGVHTHVSRIHHPPEVMFYIYRDVWTVNEEHYWVNENFPPLFRCRDYFKAQQEALCKLQLLSREIRNEVIAEYFPRAQYNLWYDWPPPNTNVKYFQKGNSKQAYSKKFRPSAEEDAAIKAFFAESPEIDKQKAKKEEEDPKPLYPKATKGLANSRFAKDAIEKDTTAAQVASPSVAASNTKAELAATNTTAAQASTPVTSTTPAAT